jgi:hypothetical protein
MSDVDRLHSDAARYIRLARSISDPAVAAMLMQMAEEAEKKAAAIKADAISPTVTASTAALPAP